MQPRFPGAILAHFAPQAHPLTLVSDPDRLLADEDLSAELVARGFRLIEEADPVALRQRVAVLRPWTAERPLVVITAGSVNQLPYDLWQHSYHVTLALHTFFPNLAYPVVQALSPAQRWRLSQVAQPRRVLGRQGTIAFVLRHVFQADLAELQQPASLLAWLAQVHQQAEPLPALFAETVLARLHGVRSYIDWPLDDLLSGPDAFTAFVREQWRGYVQQQTGQPLKEGHVHYVVDFSADVKLQDALPDLLRSGALEPVRIAEPARLPRWAHPAVLAPDEDSRPRRAADLDELLRERLSGLPRAARWEDWLPIARAWAELTSLRYDPDRPLAPAHHESYQNLQTGIDRAFLTWLRDRYAALGGQILPKPHHVHHVPHFIAYQRRQTSADRVALLVLDAMALPDWAVIGPVWRARHADWRFAERLLLAQIPSITCVSRQALVSGLRPAEFAKTLHTVQAESRRWSAFWAREGIPSDACELVHLGLDRGSLPAVMGSARTKALCLIDSKLDEMTHDEALGTAGFHASLRVWVEGYGRQVEQVIASLLAQKFTVYVASDHGHVEARGVGQPSEGLTVDTRGKRARIYGDRRAALNVQQGYSETILWGQDGLLPEALWVLMLQKRQAFDTPGAVAITHGGLTLDEMVVPLITISLEG